MEVIKTEAVVHERTYYKSWDEKYFDTEEACLAYENDPIIVAWKSVQSFLIRKTWESSLSYFYSESDNEICIFKPTSSNDIAALNSLIRGRELDDSYIGKLIFVDFDSYRFRPNVFTIDEYVDAFKKSVQDRIDDEETDADYDYDEDRIIRKTPRNIKEGM